MNEQLKSYKTVEQIAKKHRMDVSDIQKQLDMGAPIEHEHTNNQKLAVEIALQHLDEIPDYYTRLKKMEASAKKEHKKFKDVTEEKGLWANINARRKKGLSPKKPGEKGYPKTLDIEEGLKQARKNVGASKCWKNKKVGTPPTKIKGGEEVPNCVPVSENTDTTLDYDWHTPVRERADRYCPKCEKLETRTECKYGTRYWDMFSLPAELISSKKDYNIVMPHPANEEKDHEYSMARSEISTIIGAAKRLKKKIGKGEGNIEAWVQSKITKAADYIDAAADYVDSGEMKKESVTIQDANGNDYVEFIDLIKPEKIKTFNQFVTEAKKSEMKCNSPKSEPVGDSLTGKSHVVKACEGGKEKLIRFGQRGVKGSPKKKGESDEYASRRHRFQTRHAKNIAKGKMSAAYWADKVKW